MRVLVVAREAGAAAAVIPVARHLAAAGDEVLTIAFQEAVASFERARVPLLAFPDDCDADAVAVNLARLAPDALLTGTSMYPDRDGLWWHAARQASIPTLAVLDHWSTLAERFSAREPFDCVPDAVSTVDESSAAQLRALGFPGSARAGGHPHFDHLIGRGRALDRAAARRVLAIPAEQLVMVFVSEPLARQYGTSLNYRPDELFPYTEEEVLGAVGDAFDEVASTGLVVVKLHPLEDAGAYAGMALEADPDRVRVLRSCPPDVLIGAADVVVGMTSSLLIEAALMGAPTMSVRPRDDPRSIELGAAGLLVSVCDTADLVGALEALLSGDERSRPGAAGLRNAWTGSTERVADMVRAAVAQRTVPR